MGVWTTEKWSKQCCVYAQFVEPVGRGMWGGILPVPTGWACPQPGLFLKHKGKGWARSQSSD